MPSPIAAPWSRIETSIGGPRRRLCRAAVMLSNMKPSRGRIKKGDERCRGDFGCQRPDGAAGVAENFMFRGGQQSVRQLGSAGSGCCILRPMRLRPATLALAFSCAANALPPAGRTQLLQAAHHDVSAPLWLLRPAEPGLSREEREPRRVPLPDWSGPERDPVLQENAPSVLAPQAGSSFEGIGQGFVGAPPAQVFQVIGIPPDPEGDVGPSHYVQMVNSSFAVFSKQAALLFGPVPTRTLFSGFGGPCETNDDGDGVVLYDPLADRWLVTQFAIGNATSGPFLECGAVSRTPDPTGQYARYAYSYPMFNDYPKIGVWPDAYYATYNLYPNAK